MVAVPLNESYTHCAEVARTQARNFYYSFLVLPPEKRAALCAVYAFMRYCDDISDEDGTFEEKRARMEQWRAALDRAFEGDYGESAVLPAFHDTAVRYRIPKRLFEEVIEGAEMDLTPSRCETFEELYRYCYHVASAVGLVCIHVFGFTDPNACGYAEKLGIAFQLTNILRDLKEDASMGRVYLPQEDLRRFDYPEADLARGVVDERFLALMRFQVERAERYYEEAKPLFALIDPVSRPCLYAMSRIYRGILEQIVRQNYDVFRTRARVPTWGKVAITGRAWLQSRLVRKGQPSNA